MFLAGFYIGRLCICHIVVLSVGAVLSQSCSNFSQWVVLRHSPIVLSHSCSVVLSHARSVLSDSLVLSHFLLSQGHSLRFLFSRLVPCVILSYCRPLALSFTRRFLSGSQILVLSHCCPPYLLHITAITCSGTGIFLSLLFNSRSLVARYCYLLEAHFESI